MIENGLEINARQEATRESTLRILLVDGGDEQSHVIGGSVRMAPGFVLLSGVIID